MPRSTAASARDGHERDADDVGGDEARRAHKALREDPDLAFQLMTELARSSVR
jgi:hypothetical protein